MKLIMCSIFDSAVNTYSPPFCVRSLGLALRDFRAEATNPQSRISKSPSDYSLFVLGTYDDESAGFFPEAAPRRVVGAHEIDSMEVPNG